MIWTMILWTVDKNEFGHCSLNGSELGENKIVTALRSVKVPVYPGGPYLSTKIFVMQRLREKTLRLRGCEFKVKKLLLIKSWKNDKQLSFKFS